MIKIFADTSNLNEIKDLNKNPIVSGFTTNPTLMKKAGILNYTDFCKEVLKCTDKPVSFEVFADDFREMERQARIISSWGDNVYVKIPITTTEGEWNKEFISRLIKDGIKLNITAITHWEQTLYLHDPAIISVFAGRIADTGVNPVSIVQTIKRLHPNSEILWASPREVFNIYQAQKAGADIITCTPEIIRKYEAMKGKDLFKLSMETVEMFYTDGKSAGYTL